MAHMPQITAAWQEDQGKYDFVRSFQHIAPVIREADVAIANLETTLAGREAGYSGYPMFNAPDELGQALKETGFDIIGHANNHTLDRGVNGLIRTHRVLTDLGLVVAGTRLEETDDTVVYFEHDGVTFGLVTGTYGLNGLRLPSGREYMVNMLDEDRLLDDVRRASGKADGVIAFLHWGTEYMETPNANQLTLTEALWEAGAIAVIGHHPHVVQQDVFEDGRLAMYSLGNFISNQIGAKRRTGIIYNVTFEKNRRTETLSIRDASYVPVFTARNPQVPGRPHELWILDPDFKHDYPWSPQDRQLAQEGYQYVISRMQFARQDNRLPVR